MVRMHVWRVSAAHRSNRHVLVVTCSTVFVIRELARRLGLRGASATSPDAALALARAPTLVTSELSNCSRRLSAAAARTPRRYSPRSEDQIVCEDVHDDMVTRGVRVSSLRASTQRIMWSSEEQPRRRDLRYMYSSMGLSQGDEGACEDLEVL